MKTNTITTIFLVGILAFSFAACSKSEAPTPKIAERTETPKPPKQQQPTVPPLNQEAVALAEKEFSETWTQVGDSWFTLVRQGRDNYFFQIRGVTHQVKPWDLSEADTLNGLQWFGDVYLSCSVHRVNKLDSQQGSLWSEWRKGTPTYPDSSDYLFWRYQFGKKNGKWDDRKTVAGYISPFTKPSEEQIKKILPQ